MRRVGVLVAGGGLSGLALAWELNGRGVECLLVEQGDRLGGLVHTARRDGFLLDGGPDAFLLGKPGARELLVELGIDDEVVPTNPEKQRVYVLFRGTLQPLPEGMRLAAPTRVTPLLRSSLFSFAGKLRMIGERFVPRRPRDGGEESIASFVARRFGREALERVGEPLLAGIHCGSPERLSMDFLFPRLVELEARYGSVTRGLCAADAQAEKTAFGSLRGGMGRVVDALADAIPPDAVRLSEPVLSIGRDDRGFVSELGSGDRVSSKALVLALPIRVSERLARPGFPDVAEALKRIETVSTAVVFHAFERGALSHPLDGYGFVVPESEPNRLLAATFVSTKLPERAPAGRVLLRTFLGGRRDPDILSLSDEELARLSLGELEKAIGRVGEPLFSSVVRWKERTPQVELGHERVLHALRKACERTRGLFVIGNGIGSVGIPDAVTVARATARSLAEESSDGVS